MKEEQVLVISRAQFEATGSFQGIRTEGVDAAVSSFLESSAHHFMPRSAAEDDPSFKQLIPYCVFRCGDQILHYTRGKAGAERRLHAKISVGVGGHINPTDAEEGRTGAEMYFAAVARELEEELVIQSSRVSRIVALLNDDSNPVGAVHLGIVHLIDLESTAVQSREDALCDLQFSSLSALRGPMHDSLESWSQLCIAYLADSSMMSVK